MLIGQVLLGEPLARQRELDDRHGGGAVIEDQRRRRPRRHLFQQRLRDCGDLCVRGPDVDVGLKEDLDDAKAVIGVGDDVFDVVDGGGQRPLKRRGDAPGHLVGRQTGILPDHADHGDTDIRENVGRRPQRGQRPDDQEQQREHDERVRPAQGDTDQSDHRKGIPKAPLATGIGALPVNKSSRFT